MAEIKSTFEIVEERLKGLDADDDDIKQLRERDLRFKSEKLIKRLLNEDDVLDIKGLLSFIDKYQDEESVLLKRLLFDEVIKSISLSRYHEPIMALGGLGYLPSGGEGELIEEVEEIVISMKEEMDREKRDLDERLFKSSREELKSIGIRGSAVHFNLEDNPEWIPKKEGILRRFEERLDNWKHSRLIRFKEGD